jgi:hypothetical protein
MNPELVALIVFAAVFGGAMSGMFLATVLPPEHLNAESREVVKLGMGLVATMAALVLGLVTASAKSDFDTQDSAFRKSTAEVLQLDRVLAEYGPEVADIRTHVKQLAQSRLELTWPEEMHSNAPVRLDQPEILPTIEGLTKRLRDLKPQDESQQWLKNRALDLASRVMEARWMALGSVTNTVPMPFLTIVVFWLSIIFASFGLVAPRNATVITVLLVCAASVAASLFLIIEMDDPFHGMMKVSSAPLRFAIANLGQ